MSELAAQIDRIDQTTARPAQASGPGPAFGRLIGGAWLKAFGWTIHGDWPPLAKAVLVAAPHTSNWDGLHMLAAAGFYRVRLRWMGKKSLTQSPFGWLVKALGCVPIDRAGSHDVVAAMARAFAESERMILAIPPEGTRTAVRDWKSGCYHIARAADVPIILSVLDYGRRQVRLAAVVCPSGDYDADLALIRGFYADAQGKRREQFIA